MSRDVWCRHYRAISYKTCHAGVVYDELAISAKLPCWGDADRTPCAKFASWTEAENAERAARLAERLERMCKAMVAIDEEHKRSKTWGGRIKCPNCDGTLAWSKARSNGHVHARCSTPDCVSFMQ